MDDTLIRSLLSLGIGGVLSAVMLLLLLRMIDQRVKDAKAEAGRWEQQTKLLVEIVGRNAEVMADVQAAVSDMAVTNREVRSAVESLGRDLAGLRRLT
jgi:hypothetical protein